LNSGRVKPEHNAAAKEFADVMGNVVGIDAYRSKRNLQGETLWVSIVEIYDRTIYALRLNRRLTD
jgi:hypothetical protein